LRTFLFGAVAVGKATLEARVRSAVERVRRHHDTPVSVSVIDGGCRIGDGDQELLARAIGEAVANALEHADATRVVVFVETDEEGQVFASIRDDGAGFDVARSNDGHGISESIVGRVESIGGRTAITSSQAGTEVCIWSSVSS
jgi:signal transduction histidine kinase